MKIHVHNELRLEDTYRANRCRSMLNVDWVDASTFDREFDLALEGKPWTIGAVVGPSGTGKSSVGRLFWGGGHLWEPEWDDRPIVEVIGPDWETEAVTQVLVDLGLVNARTWLEPFSSLSNGEQFRANLARLLCDGQNAVVDEFTSAVDRRIAEQTSRLFAHHWRRLGNLAFSPPQVVLLTCHHDITEWLDPDWILETNSGEFALTRGKEHLPEFGRIPVLGDLLGSLVV